MDRLLKLLAIPFFIFNLNNNSISQDCKFIQYESCKIFYTEQDSNYISEYSIFITSGIKLIENYFEKPFNLEFDIYIHPNRESLDRQWQIDWQIPDFKSECWMVASGVSTRMDMLSPSRWIDEACEHSFENKQKTQNLITHELVHIFHGQNNVSPDFSEVYGIDWYIEGLATFVSGQCDDERIENIKKALNEGNTPESLNNFWSGNLKYGLSGTLVMYLDHKYGKETILALLKYNKLSEILNILETTEHEIIRGWENYILTI